jgi:hypothetical protein
MTVVQDVVTYASEQNRAHGAASARAHYEEIVTSVSDLVQQRGARGLGAQHGAGRQVIGAESVNLGCSHSARSIACPRASMASGEPSIAARMS